ncbi:hypothetical protein LY71_10419 [Geodermatophilus tzadiensis]|uniref:Uncharacterized protein n=1 Tax=Geodermatophilus tzadiensis TaxID=1137988 RepID=A0A2T0TWF4_9ACTN|nr:hypothetical protein LY71_10419 [Geodermatophilus tzadiensis]
MSTRIGPVGSVTGRPVDRVAVSGGGTVRP